MKIVIYSIIAIVASVYFVELAFASSVCTSKNTIQMPTSVENHRAKGAQNANTSLAMMQLNQDDRCLSIDRSTGIAQTTDRLEEETRHLFSGEGMPAINTSYDWQTFSAASTIDSRIDRHRRLMESANRNYRVYSQGNLPRELVDGARRTAMESFDAILRLNIERKDLPRFPICTRNPMIKLNTATGRIEAHDNLVVWRTPEDKGRLQMLNFKLTNLSGLSPRAQYCIQRPIARDIKDCRWVQVSENFPGQQGNCNPLNDSACARSLQQSSPYNCTGKIACTPVFLEHSNAGAEISISDVKCSVSDGQSCSGHALRCAMDGLASSEFDPGSLEKIYPSGENGTATGLQAQAQ